MSATAVGTGREYFENNGRGQVRQRRYVPMGLVGLLAVGLLAACAGGASSSSSPSSTAKGSAKKSPYVIGVMADRTGADATTGVAQLEGIDFYVHQINAHGGVDGHDLQLDVCDSASLPTGATACAARLQDVPTHIVTLQGGLPPALAAEAVLNNQDLMPSVIPVLAPRATTSAFQVPPLEAAHIVPLIALLKGAGIATIGVMATDDASGTAQTASITSGATAAGMHVVTKQMAASATDVTPQLVSLKQAGAQVIFVAALGTSAAAVLEGASALNLGLPIVLGAGAVTNAFLHSLPTGVPPHLYGLSDFVPSAAGASQHAAWESFLKQYRAFAHSPADEQAVTSYEVGCLVSSVLAATGGSGNVGAMVHYLKTGGGVPCLGFTIQFNNPAINAGDGGPVAVAVAGSTASQGWVSVAGSLKS